MALSVVEPIHMRGRLLTARLVHQSTEGTLTPLPVCGRQPKGQLHRNNISCSINADFIKFSKEGNLEEAVDRLHAIYQRGIPVNSYAYDSLLQTCARVKTPVVGKQIHAHMVISGLEQNVFLSTNVVMMYSKCGYLLDARQVFDRIPEQNVLSWNAMIVGYARYGLCEEAVALFRQMQVGGLKPDLCIITSVLPACASLAALEQGKEIHAYIFRTGIEPDVMLGNCLLNMYAKCGSVSDARQVFDKMPERNVVSWNSIIAGYAQNGQGNEALSLFHKMGLQGLKPNAITWNSMIAGYAQNGLGDEALELLGQMQLAGLEPDVITWNTVIAGCAQNGQGDKAVQIFRRMQQGGIEPNVISWNSLIAGHTQNGNGNKALEFFCQMQLAEVKPNPITIVSVLSTCSHLAALRHGKEIHGHTIRSGFECDVFVGNALIDMYTKCGDIEDAHKFFNKMAQRDVISWTVIIASYAQEGGGEVALKLFNEMQLSGIQPNVVTWNAMISGFAQNGHDGDALKVFHLMQRLGVKPDVISWNAMISGHSQNGNGDEALKLFHEMQLAGLTPDVITWNAIIVGFVQNGFADEALKMFSQMQLAGVKPSSVTLAAILPACAHLSDLQKGKQIHDIIVRSHFESEVSVGNALVDMYAKCGSLEDGYRTFEKMFVKNVISWNAMIVGYGIHGYGEAAINLLHQMQWVGMQPDHITFIGVLCACSHAGLVDEGHKYFDCMSRDYHITPSMEHYACMVDLLGRAGLLDQAQDFISKMPLEPSASVWGALLAACRIRRNIQLAEQVAGHLFQLEPKIAGNYVLLSNVYAAAGRWDDVAKVRKMMNERGLKKKPGCSWIEHQGKIHAFVVGDKTHPQKERLYAILESLAGQMEEAGYLHDTNFVFHNVEQEEKEYILCGHSEKLAVAFGLINTSLGSPIRIFKNLRICGDCHTVFKFISKIARREIILRDTNRFHHFVDGLCCCKNYW